MDDYETDRARRVRDLRAALAGALELYDWLVTFAIDNADASGDLPDEWRLPRFTLRGGAGTYYVEPALDSDLNESELAAMVRACERAPTGCRVNLRYRAGAGAGIALEVWAR